MSDFYGETVTIYVFNDGTTTIEFYNFDLYRMVTKEFENETSVYSWAYKRGYRE